MSDQCASYNDKGQVCRDGFIQKPFCSGHGACHVCGHVSERALPYCLRDELPAHFVKDDGTPAFYREPYP
jgi:hypothetical protein